MGKILLFYKYVDIEHPKRIAKWQEKLCTDLKLTGRIILAHEGINTTLGGTDESIDRYQAIMKEHPLFGDIDFKESPGGADYFPRLSIKIKNEIVRLGVDPEKIKAKDGGIHLNPDATHALIKESPKDLIILDTRNTYESKIGTFVNAITPELNSFRELPDYIDQNLEMFKDKQVLMFCTGGVRCERATAYLKSKDVAKEVYQVEGGIQRYTESYPDGFFRGKNYVFDARVTVPINNDILSECAICNQPADDYTNCLHARCNKHYICCKDCLQSLKNCCSKSCLEAIAQGAPLRPDFKGHTTEQTHAHIN